MAGSVGAGYAVVGQPRVRGWGEAAGQERPVVRQVDGGAEQRAVLGRAAGRAGVGAARRARPVPLALEGVGRQVDPAGAGPAKAPASPTATPRDVQPRPAR